MEGLRGEFDEAMTEIFTEFDNVPVDGQLIQVTGAGDYTPEAGRVKLTTPHIITVFLTELTESQSIELCGGMGTYQLLLQLSTIPYIPKVGDWYVIDGEKYYINLTDVDPARVSHTSYCSTGAPITEGLK